MKKIFGIIFLVVGFVCLPQVFSPSFPETVGGLIGVSLVTFLPAFFLLRNKKNDSNNGIGCHEIKGIMNRYNGDFEIVSKPQDKYTVRYLLVFKSTNTLYTL